MLTSLSVLSKEKHTGNHLSANKINRELQNSHCTLFLNYIRIKNTILTCRAFTLDDGCLDILCSCVHVPAVEKTESLNALIRWTDCPSVGLNACISSIAMCMLQREWEK